MSYNNEYSSNSNDEYSSTGRQGGLNDRTTGSGAYGNDSSYGNDSLSSGANPGSGLGRDQYSDSSNTYRSGELGNDDIASRGNTGNTLGRDEFSGGNSGSGIGRDEFSSGRDNTYGSSNAGRDTFSSSGDNYGSGVTGSSAGDYGHHHRSAGEALGQDDLKPSHGIERDTHHTTGGNYPSIDDNYGSGTSSGVGFGNKSSYDRDTFDDSSNTRFGSSTDTGAYSGSTDFGSGATGGAGYGNKATSGRDTFDDSSNTRFGSSTDTGAYSGSNEYGSGSTGGAGYGNKSSEYTTDESSGKQGDSTAGKLMSKLGGMMKNERMVEKGEAKREAAGAYNERSDY
ncbi:unnamed protein product [Aureobasidium vineae]|uniref:Stress protein DDR48 n=1 Tax=Aureobasidium vineae TaxID=2773715 RepID=A0A9N8JFZ1_9PEZI|nr:unnamed protein product [Aureobasidium vineae]